MRARTRGQAVVEFGIVALLFTLLMFAVVDFGLLLNTWLSVSSGARDVARSASVGKSSTFITDQASRLRMPAVSTSGFSGVCCDATSALSLTVEYFDRCVPGPTCAPLAPNLVSNVYYGGTCSASCAHPLADDSVRVKLVAQGAQVITPLVRPFFGCTNGANPNCNVALTSTTVMRFEGQEF